MTLPACFVRAADAGAAVPLWVVAREGFGEWLATQDAALHAHDFRPRDVIEKHRLDARFDGGGEVLEMKA